MRWRWQAAIAAAAALAIVIVAIVTIRMNRAPSLPVGETVQLTPTAEAPVASVTRVIGNGARVDWSHELDLIAFDRKGDDNKYDVWVMEPDGSNEVCLTCETPGLPGGHVGQPAWHPSGEWIILQAEKPEHPGGSLRATPGIGVENDLWIVTPDGSRAFQLTSLPDNTGVLHPHFSHDGTRLLWSQMIEPPEGLLGGNWAIKLADFVVEGGEPRLENIETLQPLGERLHETHGFSPDDSKIIFTAQKEGEPDWAFDIYTLELATGDLTNLTETDDQWDEHAHFSPSGDKIVWMSSTDCGCDPGDLGDLRTDLWLMDADGSNKTRLTWFSDGDYPARAGRRVIAGDNSWSPDGRRLALFLIADRNILSLLNLRDSGETIVIVEFVEPL